MRKSVVGIIGGSGLYDIDIFKDAKWIKISTPWGEPSDHFLKGRFDNTDVVFLPRHGRGHIYSPSTVPYRANIDGMKQLGVTNLISISACGSFRKKYKPGDFVIVNQFIDRTFAREKSFFDKGCVGHVSVANPVCSRVADACYIAAKDSGINVHMGGVYLAMEGPQFSTIAESQMYRDSWNCDVIGMTNMPEAKLAREAEICYATVAMVTDYDSWHPKHGAIDIVALLEVLRANSANARVLVSKLPSMLGGERMSCPQECDIALDFGIMTHPQHRSKEMVGKLGNIAGRVLRQEMDYGQV